jgi:hypothetical protein
MTYVAISYIVFWQIPHPVVSVTKDGSVGLLIKLLLLICERDWLIFMMSTLEQLL